VPPSDLRRLCVPAFLAISSVAAPACGDGNEPTTEPPTTEPATGTDATTGATTGATTDDPTTGMTTETGDPPMCERFADQAACEAEEACAWTPEVGGCIVDCSLIPDEPTCQAQDYCLWIGDKCELVLI
jgi:hypothetical protein